MLLGAATVAPLIRRLCPEAEIQSRERFSRLIYAGPRKLTRLPRRSAVVALLRRSGLRHRRTDPPPARRGGGGDGLAQPAHPQRPGRPVPVRRGRFSGRHRRHRHGAEHGRRPCRLRRPAQVRRTAHAAGCTPTRSARSPGRAGRYRKDGTFGVTGECSGDGRRPRRRSRGSHISSRWRRRSGATRGWTSSRCRD